MQFIYFLEFQTAIERTTAFLPSLSTWPKRVAQLAKGGALALIDVSVTLHFFLGCSAEMQRIG